MPNYLSRKAAAAALGVTERSLDRWRLEPGFPESAEDDTGHFDIATIKAWRDANEKRGSEGDQQIATINKAIKLQKLAEIQKKNLLLQLTIDEKNRDLLPRELVHDVLMEVASMIRGLGRQLQQGGNVAAAKLIDTQIDRMKSMLKDRLK